MSRQMCGLSGCVGRQVSSWVEKWVGGWGKSACVSRGVGGQMGKGVGRQVEEWVGEWDSC